MRKSYRRKIDWSAVQLINQIYRTLYFQDYLNDIAQDPVKSKLCKQRVLCRTLAGNLVYTLTITSPYKQPSEAKVMCFCRIVIVFLQTTHCHDIPRFVSSQIMAMKVSAATFMVSLFIQCTTLFFQHRKAVVITSRVHPGESNASLMMKGYLDYLLSNHQDAKVIMD